MEKKEREREGEGKRVNARGYHLPRSVRDPGYDRGERRVGITHHVLCISLVKQPSHSFNSYNYIRYCKYVYITFSIGKYKFSCISNVYMVFFIPMMNPHESMGFSKQNCTMFAREIFAGPRILFISSLSELSTRVFSITELKFSIIH